MNLNYSELIENIPLGVFLVSLEKTIVNINSWAEKLLKIKKEDFLLQKLYNLDLFAFNKSIIENFLNKLDSKENTHVNLSLIKQDKEMYIFECTINLIQSDSQKLIQICLLNKNTLENELSSDISKLVKKIENGSKPYGQILERSNDFITILNNNLEIEYINEDYHKQIMGYSKEEILGKKAINFVHKDDIAKLSRFIGKTFKKLQGKDEIRCIAKDGKYIWVEIKGRVFIDADGRKKALLISRDITKRKSILEQLKESEEKFRTIAEQSFMAIGIIQDDRFKYANKKFSEIFGYDLDTIYSWKNNEFMRLIHEEDREFIIEQLRKKQLNSKDVLNNYNFRAYNKDGKVKWLDIFSKTIHYGGKFADLFTIIDITEKKKSEQKILESQRKYKRLFESMTNVVVLTDNHGIIIDANPKTQEISGYTKDELIGKNYSSLGLFSPEHIKIFKKRYISLMAGNQVFPIEIHTKNRNGKELWLLYDSSLIEINDNNYVEAIIQDITERKNAELKLKNSEQNYRNMIENLKEGYFEVDLHGNFTFFNDAICKLLEYNRSELMGMNFRQYMNEEMAEKTFNAFNQVYKTEVERKNFQYIMTTKKGKQKYGETTIHLKYDLEGQKIGFRGFMRDITDKKKAEKIIEEENERLKQLDKMRKEFVNRASHELKTPLTSIHGALQLIEQMDNNILNEDMKLFLDIAKKGSNRLKKLIFNLLDISRIDAKKFQIQKKKVNIVKLFKDCIKDMKYLIKERNLTISVNLPKKLEVNIDQIRIEQVLINLLSNAIKNTPPYGKIFISVRVKKYDVLFYVKDNGIGLTTIELDKIFQKFSRIERESEGLNISAEGSGLGLYISKEIVETHGGEIWAESKGRNEGATFYVRLPKEIV